MYVRHEARAIGSGSEGAQSALEEGYRYPGACPFHMTHELDRQRYGMEMCISSQRSMLAHAYDSVGGRE